MATTYDKGSLVMIPSGVKEDKLYSIKPTDGSGDFTFSRGSDIQATRVNASGLIEKAKENLLLYSQDFTNAAWSKSNVSATGGQTDPNGGNTASLIETTTASSAYFYQSQTGAKTFSIYAKSGSRSNFSIISGLYNNGASFDLSAETTSTAGAGVASKIEDVGGGWYRCSVFVSSSTEMIVLLAYITGGDMNVGDNVYFAFAQSNHGLIAQDYVETTTTAVVEGLTADLPRLDYSGGASCPSLLLEPSRTNLVPNSEYLEETQWAVLGVTLDVNNTTSPEGVSNAYKITDDTSTGYHKITESNLFTADGTMRSWSVFVKKGTARYCAISHATVFSSDVNSLIFDMEDGVYTNEGDTDYFDIVHDPINMGNGWWRIGFSSDINSGSYDNFSIAVSQGATWSGNLSYTGDGSLNFYAYGAQCESGSYQTSYIPTYGTAANRGADVCNKTSITDLIGQTEGSVFFDFVFNGMSNTNGAIYPLLLSDASAAERFEFVVSSAKALVVYALDNSSIVGEVRTSNSYMVEGTRYKIGVSYSTSGGLNLYINGTLIDTDALPSIPSNTAIYLNDFQTTATYQGLSPYNQVLLFKSALTNAELAALTTI